MDPNKKSGYSVLINAIYSAITRSLFSNSLARALFIPSVVAGNACGSAGGVGIDLIGIGDFENLKVPDAVPVGAKAAVYVNVFALTTVATLNTPLGALELATASTIFTLQPAFKLCPLVVVTVTVVPE